MTNIAQYIDHTLLRPDATESDIKKLCLEANEYGFASVCVAPFWAALAAKEYRTTTVINFPHGNSHWHTPNAEISEAIFSKAKEFDVVINVGRIKSGDWVGFESSLEMLTENMYLQDNRSEFTLKYIVEIGYLTDEELFRIADLLIKYKVDFIKTCTGYGPRGVTVEDIVKIKKHVGDRIKIKASGGIKTYDFARQLIEAGADRIGCSNSIGIVKEFSNGGQGTELGASTATY